MLTLNQTYDVFYFHEPRKNKFISYSHTFHKKSFKMSKCSWENIPEIINISRIAYIYIIHEKMNASFVFSDEQGSDKETLRKCKHK